MGFLVNEQLNFPALPDRTGYDGDTVSSQVYAADMLGHPLTFSAAGLPEGVTINATTGVISGTIPPGETTYGGPQTATVTVSDGTYSASRQFQWEVLTRIAVAQVADRTGTEGDTVSVQVNASSPGGTGTFTYGASGLPDGVMINASTGLISGTLAPGAGQPDEPWMTTVTVTDGTYFGVMGFQWTVNERIAVAALADRAATEGDAVLFQATASNPGGGLLS
ncbi:MAG: putative Ig domain-containing protein [Gemmataceae bacterium]|nr:putative Ig domain-containing protein [Gemmataceae bacterium]